MGWKNKIWSDQGGLQLYLPYSLFHLELCMVSKYLEVELSTKVKVLSIG